MSHSCTVTLDMSVLCTFMHLPTSSQISWCSCLTETTLLQAWIFPLSLVCCTFSARPNLPSFCLLYHNHYFLFPAADFFFLKMNSVTIFFWVSVYQVTREAMWSLAILQCFLFLNIVYLPSLAIISLETLIHAKECHLFCHLIGQGKLLIGCRQNWVHWWGNWCHFKELFTFVRSWKSTTCVSLGPQCKMLMGIFSIIHACQEHSKFSLYLQPGLAIVRCSALWPTDY